MSTLSIERLKQIARYDSDTGDFLCIKRIGRRLPGELMGTTRANGYVKIKIDGRDYAGHRLAWFFVHHKWPQGEIDHIDGNPSNNAIANLRIATRSLNVANSKLRRDSQTGFKGVTLDKSTGQWRARIRKKGKLVDLGGFASKEQAHATYCGAAILEYGEFARFG